ncbi:PREDICTED: putative deoxyribose-phosphate aldolase [Phaethon lepturus]|uniref:putative deoxyribose-phosphate aldolase n=1 Tax=Phaethon lepturus TaxID=97097 RepID=UPI000530A287|nr:PREDICTED: putative deoxyribose-phosphate aldolase [Phaethon lepturus]
MPKSALVVWSHPTPPLDYRGSGCTTNIALPAQPALSAQPGLYEEIRQCREACGEAHMKTILATGELGSLANVYKASMIAMMAGSDFIKTSTGKEVENATFPVGVVMMRAIREFYWQTGNKVGFKPAGGIRTAREAITWLMLVKEELGVEWLTPELFRLGASSLLEDIEKQIFYHVTGSYALQHDLAMA